MVISDKYKYLYVELPLTGSTAVSNELCELYDGKKILKKHARYHEFFKIATPEQKKYFVFSNHRNPMDAVVSEFLKMKNNHKGRFTNPAEWKENGGSLKPDKRLLYKEIQQKNMSFQQYFKKYYKLPYDDWSSIAHKKFDFILKFDNLANDFDAVLKKLNIKPVRFLPQLNKTTEKEDYSIYYTPDIQQKALFIFGPFLKEWGYEFPLDWPNRKPGISSYTLYSLLKAPRQAYWQLTTSKSTPASKAQTTQHQTGKVQNKIMIW